MKTAPVFMLALALFAFAASGKDKEEKAALKAARLEQRAAAQALGATGAPPTPESATGYNAYANVRTKNIFDPTRRGTTRIDPAAARAASTSQTRSLALTGTMVTEGKSLAFFSGSASEGNRVVTLGTSVSHFKVTNIAPTQVSLEHEGKTILLDVGRALALEPAGEPGATPAIVDAPPNAGAEFSQPALPAASGDKSEVLKRMMERRAREMGK